MLKTLGIVVLCVQLIAGLKESELLELKNKCLRDKEFLDGVEICSIKDNVAVFQAPGFRCITILPQNQGGDKSNLTIKVSEPHQLFYIGAVMRKSESKTLNEIHLTAFENFTARIAILSDPRGFRVDEVKLNDKILSHNWNCKEDLKMKTDCGKRQMTDKENTFSWPWVVAIYQYKLVGNAAKYKSSGSIINTKFILTSGNALYYEGRLLLANELKAHVGRTVLLPHSPSKGFKMYNIDQVLLHEDYKYALEHNVALLRVESYIEFNDYVAPICLPTSERQLGEFGNAVGFAKDEWYPHALEDNITDSSYKIVSRDDCGKNTFLMNFKHTGTFCGIGSDKLDSFGNILNIKDSGSGLYVKKNDVYFLAGVISKVSSTDSLVVFSDVYLHLDWIKGT